MGDLSAPSLSCLPRLERLELPLVIRSNYYGRQELEHGNYGGMVPLFNIFSVTQNGDIGGAGISRFAVLGDGVSLMTNVQLNGVAAALLNLYTGIHSIFPNSVTFQVSPTTQVVDAQSGALTAEQNIPTVGNTTGVGATTYVAGTGARIYWHTVTIKNRRLIRGATYMTPLAGSAFSNSGALAGGTITQVQNAAQGYIAAITALTLVPQVYARSTKLKPDTGMLGAIAAASVSAKPCSVRSRRS